MIAQGLRLFAFAHAQHGVVWGLHLVIRNDDSPHATLACFNSVNRFTFFIQQVRGHLNRNNSVNFFGVVFQRFFFNQTQDRQRQ